MISTPSTRGRNPCECFQKARSEVSPQRSSLPPSPQRYHPQHQNGGGGGASRPAPRGRRALPLSGRCRQNGGGGGKYERAVSFPALRGKPGGAMDVSGCMKSLLLAATQYKAAKTPCNAALVQRSLEVRMVPGLQAAGGEAEERRSSGWGVGSGVPLGSGSRAAPLAPPRCRAAAGSAPPRSPWALRPPGARPARPRSGTRCPKRKGKGKAARGPVPSSQGKETVQCLVLFLCSYFAFFFFYCTIVCFFCVYIPTVACCMLICTYAKHIRDVFPDPLNSSQQKSFCDLRIQSKWQTALVSDLCLFHATCEQRCLPLRGSLAYFPDLCTALSRACLVRWERHPGLIAYTAKYLFQIHWFYC